MKAKALPQLPPRKEKRALVERLPVPVPQEKFTAAQVIQAIQTTRGMVTAAAKILGCDRGTVLNYRDKYPQVAQELLVAKELQLDTAELQLFKAIDRSEPWSICFFLKTIGRNRGYVEKHEVTSGQTLEDLVLGSMKQP